MKQEILTHLRNHKPYAGASLAEFLKTAKAKNTQKEVRDALQSPLDEESIEYTSGSPVNEFYADQFDSPMAEFNGHFDGVKITWQG